MRRPKQLENENAKVKWIVRPTEQTLLINEDNLGAGQLSGSAGWSTRCLSSWMSRRACSVFEMDTWVRCGIGGCRSCFAAKAGRHGQSQGGRVYREVGWQLRNKTYASLVERVACRRLRLAHDRRGEYSE
jgi:hypothetical protein